MNKGKAEEDDYWHSSKYSAFTFDDDDYDFTKLKESQRAVNSIRGLVEDDCEDDEDVEKVSWSGEPVGSILWGVKETASSLRTSGDTQNHGFPKIQHNPPLPRQSSGYSLSSLFKGKNKTSSFSSLLDSLPDTSMRVYAPELRKPRSEYKDYDSDWNSEETIRRMRQGKAYSLENFHSLQEKLLLLDEAVSSHNSNVITAVLIFLKRTLSKAILFRELAEREVALRHFIHLLKETGEQRILVELLKKLGRMEDMALLQYKEHISIKDENQRKDFLKTCLSLPFSPDDSTHVQDHYMLLERQIIIEANDKRTDTEIFKKHPRKASILNMPIITTLYYSCFYHYGESEGTFSSPANIRKTFRISEKQYFLTALGARAKLKQWSDVDRLCNTTNWLGYTKKKSPIGFQRVVEILHKNGAPLQVLQDYMSLVDNTEVRVSLAQKFKCHDIVINTYKELKDRQQLIVYQSKLERGSPEYQVIDELIHSLNIRWKN
ncbi:spermatogenesis-defective protein 39 homolog [Denticeps clupeoides]|uniref:Spermatogenesis-defective protein 39 homolog n=1 Tax=Denticeps clupeoides TaxID=299321 RepID=A0AAY4DD44_9TELE|nr:spermatogenesis-defective protein 39 homolog [Denticeps clupeoides]